MVNRLLVVGTSTVIEQLFKIALMDSDIEVSTAHSHIEAENIITSESPDVIFIDPSLKDKNAFDFARSIKTSRKKPVVILKSSIDSWDEKIFSESGADCVLNKPFEPAALISVLKKFNGKKNTTVRKSASSTQKKSADTKKTAQDTSTDRSQRSAISLLKKAELENAKKFIKSNLVKKSKTAVNREFNSSMKEAIARENIKLSDEELDEKINSIAKEVIERIVWEVVPRLAETLIKEEIKRLTEDRQKTR